MSRLSVLAFVLFLSILPGLAVPAQDGEPAQPAADFFEAVEVDVVNIDVVVTSRSGEPVTGLTADDFVLLEGGEPVDITYFTEIRDGRAGADVDAANGSAGAVITSGAGSAPAAQPVEPRFMIFLFDQRALQGVNRQRFAEAAEEFLEDELRPGDQALVAYADRGLTILQGFTDDRARVRAAFRFVTDLSEGGTMKIYGRRALIGDMARASFGIDASGAIDQSRIDAQARMFGNQIQQKARELYFQTIDSLGAVAVMVDSLAGIPGRKALVYVGEGLPMRPGESLFQALSNKYRNASNDPLAQNPDFESLAYDLSAEFTKVVAMAQDADVAIYPVDVAGRRADLRNDVSYGAPDQLTADVSGGPVYDSKLDLQREQNLRAGMDVLAQGSGGAVLMNSRKYSDFLDGVERDLGNYYSLGYSPDRERDGQLHRIEVELRDGA
ncbi:MAG: VWA domain-containing protein, partial [Acidobacteriota bacterium]